MKKILVTTLMLLSSTVFTATLNAQTPLQIVKLKLKIDDKEIKATDYKVSVVVNGLELEVQRVEGGFIVPPEVLSAEKVDVRVVAGKNDLILDGVRKVQFYDADWLLEVRNPPYPPEDGDDPSLGRPYLKYEVTFNFRHAEPTAFLVVLYKH